MHDRIRDAVDANGRARDQKALLIALTALRDIANGCAVDGAAQKALADIDALSGNPFARIERGDA